MYIPPRNYLFQTKKVTQITMEIQKFRFITAVRLPVPAFLFKN